MVEVLCVKNVFLILFLPVVELTVVPVQRLVERINLPFQTVTKESIANLQLKADLLITCSFGLMIPAKLIENASYTVNVHPSLLPQYRGPAPIYHSILNGDRHTGVSLQTLHPKKFDEGIIFDQSYPVPIEENETFLSLWDRLALKGAEMLLNCVQNRTYQHPTPIQTFTEPSYASMVTKQIDWYKITAVEASRLARCVDPITGVITLDEGKRSFVHLRGVKVREKGSAEQPGHYFLPKHAESRKNKLCVVCKDRTTVWVDEVKVSGKDWIDGVEFFSSAPDRFWGQRFTPWRKEFEDHDPSEFEF